MTPEESSLSQCTSYRSGANPSAVVAVVAVLALVGCAPSAPDPQTLSVDRLSPNPSLTLVNAESNADILSLLDGSVVSLEEVGRSLSVRADISASGTESVRFFLDGALARTENVAPYALAGDANGNYRPWTPSLGSHILALEIFSGARASGSLLGVAEFQFTVVQSLGNTDDETEGDAGATGSDSGTSTDADTGEPDGGPSDTGEPDAGPSDAGESEITLVLVDANTDRDIGPIADGDILDTEELGDALSVRADVHIAGHRSVRFTLNGNDRIENVEPYTIAGDSLGNYVPWSIGQGSHSLTAASFGGAGATGTLLAAASIRFSLVGDGMSDVDSGVPDSGSGTGGSDNSLLCGRIGYSADGNYHDWDDTHASPMALAVLKEAGEMARLTHFDYNNHIGQSDSEQRQAHEDNVLGAAARLGYDTRLFFDDEAELSTAVANIASEIDRSSASDRFCLICAGPMEVCWRGINAAQDEKEPHVTVISHSVWNEAHVHNQMSHQWSDIGADFNVLRDRISDQNVPAFNSRCSQWSWLEGYQDGWLYDMVCREPSDASGDASDAGMMFYLLTGNKSPSMSQLCSVFGTSC